MTEQPAPSQPRSRSEQIADILRDDILRGQYRAGERLPSERDLSSRFDASRGAVREAFKRLEQLGIATIQRGGARVVPIDHCTLDVLGPLLDLNDLPDAKLVDEVLQMVGALMDMAARMAVEKATDDELDQAQRIIDELLAHNDTSIARHENLRRLSNLFIEVADHLVLKLIANGLRTTFMSRMPRFGIQQRFDSDEFRGIAEQLRLALGARSAPEVGVAMRAMNRMIRESARTALESARTSEERISA
jgi:DNA-binding FadR family transcriptional regulator